MFEYVDAKYIYFINFTAPNLEYTDYMFEECQYLKYVKLEGILENINTSKIKSMEGMFYGCSSLDNFTLQNVNFIELQNMNNFTACTSPLYLTFKNLSFNKSLSINKLFHQNTCKDIIFRNISFNKSVNMTCMILYCEHLRNVIFENILFREEIKVTNMIYNHIRENKYLIYILFKNITISKGLIINRMFLRDNMYRYNYYNMEATFENIYAPELKKIENMCDNHDLKKIYFKNIILPKIESLEELFTNCLNLQYLYFENIYTPKLTKLENIYNLTNNLSYINFTNIDISKVTSMKGLFSNNKFGSIFFKIYHQIRLLI